MNNDQPDDLQYYSDPSSHLDRAEKCLDNVEPEYLFYTALELRYFVESRQAQYLDAQKKYTKSIPRRWKTSNQWKALKKIYGNEEIQQATNTFEDGFEAIFRYVPVSKELKGNANKLGQLLHSQDGDLSAQELANIRNFLLETLQMAKGCQSGNLLSPLLLNSKTKQPEGNIRLLVNHADGEELMVRLKKGVEFSMHVEYLPITI